MSRRHALVLAAIAVSCSACGSRAHRAAPERKPQTAPVRVANSPRCRTGDVRRLGDARRAYVGFAQDGAVAYRTPAGRVRARFAKLNVNGYPTVFGVVGAVLGADCRPAWYRVQVPLRPNGGTAFVRASNLDVTKVDVRIEVDVSARRLTLFRDGRRALVATVAVGSASTPTPYGRFYVNQRLIPEDTSGPYGPAAIGISAFSNVLTGWVQGGPVAIHGTNEPWSIGRAVSNGCIRLPNETLKRVFDLAVAGTPVIVHP